jgi:iron complex outermembrane receptor protein
MKIMRLFFLLCIAVLGNLTGQAQTVLSISGKVTNAKGEILSNVNLEVLNSGLSSQSDKNGQYQIVFLKAGKYQIAFSAVGYATLVKAVEIKKNITLDVDLSDTI